MRGMNAFEAQWYGSTFKFYIALRFPFDYLGSLSTYVKYIFAQPLFVCHCDDMDLPGMNFVRQLIQGSIQLF